MSSYTWNYGADKRLLDRMKDSSTLGYMDTGAQWTFTKTDSIGIIKGSSIDLFVDLWNSPNNPGVFWYQAAAILGQSEIKQGSPIFKLYGDGGYGRKPRWEAFQTVTQVYAQRTAGLSGATVSTFAPALATSPDQVESKMNTQRLAEMQGRRFTGDSDFARETTRYLSKKGYSALEIGAYLRAKDEKERSFIRRVAQQRINAATNGPITRQSQTATGGGSGGGRGSGRGNGSNPAANTEPVSLPQLETRLVVRMPTGYLPPSNLDSITKPALHQTFLNEDGQVEAYTYHFDYVPSNIRYSSLGSEWVEIPRAENFPFVDWGSYQLMKVSMSWIIAYDRIEPGGATVHDGIYRSVDSSINLLRQMAKRKYPVSIVNMDDLLSIQLQRSEVDGSIRGMQFVITDLNITAARRTTDPSTGKSTSPSRISVAQCEMTLQEIPIETVQIASLPNLQIPFTPPKAPRSGGIPSINDPGFVDLSAPRQIVPEALNTAAGP